MKWLGGGPCRYGSTGKVRYRASNGLGASLAERQPREDTKGRKQPQTNHPRTSPLRSFKTWVEYISQKIPCQAKYVAKYVA